MTALLVIGGLLAFLGLGFAMAANMGFFGLGLIGVGLFCGIAAMVVQARRL